MATHVGAGHHAGAAARSSSHTAVSGWTAFAAALMIFGGCMAILEGIAAIAKDSVFVATSNYTFQFSLTSWGWIHMVLGIVIALAGMALFTGAMWARVVGVGLAGIAMVANFLWAPYYPFWAVALIAVNGFIIWALCAGMRDTAPR
ncbi:MULTISPECIES: hypothetical protein [unclassified Streptomyces]|uniref:DUF7144 family membrane protein n=1 Tax=unclassified Streptomyces TaxID=2593676 RepID=UPI0037FE3DDA